MDDSADDICCAMDLRHNTAQQHDGNFHGRVRLYRVSYSTHCNVRRQLKV